MPTITDAAGNPANSLNVYLADLRENRKLRSNERERTVVGQDVFETPPPRRVDCHYLISAWSPVAVSMAIDPTLDEHALLAEAARVLGAHDELDPVAIYARHRSRRRQPPAVLAEERFPITLLPAEGFSKIAEFWGTMGEKNRWKPCVYAVVTVALQRGAGAGGADGDDDHHAHAAARRARVGRARATTSAARCSTARTPPQPGGRWRGSSC